MAAPVHPAIDPCGIMGGNEKLARQVGMYLCHNYSGKKLREIGNLFGFGETAIAEARRLLSKKIETDKQLRDEVEKVKVILGI
jgi:chromosomal replication initiation ATPase DnaA